MWRIAASARVRVSWSRVSVVRAAEDAERWLDSLDPEAAHHPAPRLQSLAISRCSWLTTSFRSPWGEHQRGRPCSSSDQRISSSTPCGRHSSIEKGLDSEGAAQDPVLVRALGLLASGGRMGPRVAPAASPRTDLQLGTPRDRQP